jgi:hypothetical protein
MPRKMGQKSGIIAPNSSVIATESVELGQKGHPRKIVRHQSVVFEAVMQHPKGKKKRKIRKLNRGAVPLFHPP